MMLANSYLTYQITTLFTVTSPEKEKKKKLFKKKKGLCKALSSLCLTAWGQQLQQCDLLQPHAWKDSLRTIKV